MSVINISNIEESRLWTRLKELDDKTVSSISASIPDFCREAAEKMTQMNKYFPEYTLHNEVHMLRVVEIMAEILGETIDSLNSLEIIMLILSAFFHDIGMVIDQKEYETLNENKDFIIHKEKWFAEHSNYEELKNQERQPFLDENRRDEIRKKIQDMNNVMLADFLRKTHALRSESNFHGLYGNDKRMIVSRVNISQHIGILCKSHNDNVNALDELLCDEQIGSYSVNMRFLAVILRLADLLDFDRDRTPDILYQSIHFSNDISISEWEKHRAVQGWEINKKIIRFTVKCKHPVYQKAVYEFMDWIDTELKTCHELVSNFSEKFLKYKLLLPVQVEKDRIQPENNSYIYKDLEFRLSRENLVALLMTDKLYHNPAICIRELVQNSLDALRFRKALAESDEIEWNHGNITLIHEVDKNGYETLTCQDNGVGMDEEIIEKYLSQVGKSYYTSPEFNYENSQLKKKNIKISICSQFGIGFMSCFMLGKKITIFTRKYYGNGKSNGKSLEVHIDGLNSIFMIKEGREDQPIGTTVIITMKKKPPFLDSRSDSLQLVENLKAYVVAAEFSVQGICKIPEIESKVRIDPTELKRETYLERLGVKQIYTIEQDMSEIDPDFTGCMRQSFLINDNGIVTSDNQETKFILSEPENGKRKIVLKNYNAISDFFYFDTVHNSQISIDGIYLCGHLRKDLNEPCLNNYPSRTSEYSRCMHVIDVRGRLKPEINPDRTPRRGRFYTDLLPKWRDLIDLLDRGNGLIWTKMMKEFSEQISEEELWKLICIYSPDLKYVERNTLWNLLPISFKDSEENIQWLKLKDVSFLNIDCSCEIINNSNNTLDLTETLNTWSSTQNENYVSNMMIDSCILFGKIEIQNSKVILKLNEQANYFYFNDFQTRIYFIDYGYSADEFISVESKIISFNNKHPIAQEFINNLHSAEKSEFQIFVDYAVRIFSHIPATRMHPEIISDRSLLMLAHYYYAVNWDEHTVCKPPYKIRLHDGILEITEKTFEDWKKLRV